MNEHPKYYITYMKFHADTIHDSANVIHKEKMMNERINELKESARPEIDWAARYHVELNSGEKEKWMNEWFEKFAELIIKECMDICKKHPSRDLENGWFADAVAPNLVQQFEEHFGVEE
jgi:hypothetical protein